MKIEISYFIYGGVAILVWIFINIISSFKLKSLKINIGFLSWIFEKSEKKEVINEETKETSESKKSETVYVIKKSTVIVVFLLISVVILVIYLIRKYLFSKE